MLACPHPDAGLLDSKHTAEPAEDHVSWRLALFLTSSNGFVVFCPWFKVSCPTSTHRFVFTLSLFLLYASVAFSPPMCCLQFLRMTSTSSSSALTSLLQQEPSRLIFFTSSASLHIFSFCLPHAHVTVLLEQALNLSEVHIGHPATSETCNSI